MKIGIVILVLFVLGVGVAYAYRRLGKRRALEPDGKKRGCSLPAAKT
jgi:hypothetical protein